MLPQQPAGVTCAAVVSRLQQGLDPPLQHAAPLAQQDAEAVVLFFFIMGHLSPEQQPISPQHDLPSAILPSFIIGHLSPEQQAILPSLWAFMSHLPSLQQLPSLPQHSIFSPDLASALS
jgi:hypothetical protein